jgi:hypothetical protein
MPVNKHSKSGLPKVASASRKPGAKASGTRIGTLQDWRGASGKSGETMNARRNAFRDGR